MSEVPVYCVGSMDGVELESGLRFRSRLAKGAALFRRQDGKIMVEGALLS